MPANLFLFQNLISAIQYFLSDVILRKNLSLIKVLGTFNSRLLKKPLYAFTLSALGENISMIEVTGGRI